MPVHVIHGRSPGPTLFVSAALHGDEINGIEIIRRVLQKKLLKSLKGTLVAIPIVNVYGLVTGSRYLPDRRDLNRSFPGSEKGSMAARLAHTFISEIVSKCTHGIDLHTGAIGRDNLPQIRARINNDADVSELARAFAAPVILNAELREGSLRETMEKFDIPVLLYEAGEALRFDEVAIRAGTRGVLNVMRTLGMLPKRTQAKKPVNSIVAHSSSWIRAPQSGILRSIVPLGASVKSGQTLGYISDPFGSQECQVLATNAGIVIGKTNLPLVHEGEALFHIAEFDRVAAAHKSVEYFASEHAPDSDTYDSNTPVLY